MSGGRTQFVALKTKTPWLDINQERHHAYAGYDGTITLVRQIDAELSNPIWSQVRTPAPWDALAPTLSRKREREGPATREARASNDPRRPSGKAGVDQPAEAEPGAGRGDGLPRHRAVACRCCTAARAAPPSRWC